MRTADLPQSIFILTSPYMAPPNTATWTDSKKQKCIMVWTSSASVEHWLQSQGGSQKHEQQSTHEFFIWALATKACRFVFVDPTPGDNLHDPHTTFDGLPKDRLIDLEDSAAVESTMEHLMGMMGAPVGFLQAVRYWGAKHPELKPRELLDAVGKNAHQILAELEKEEKQ